VLTCAAMADCVGRAPAETVMQSVSYAPRAAQSAGVADGHMYACLCCLHLALPLQEQHIQLLLGQVDAALAAPSEPSLRLAGSAPLLATASNADLTILTPLPGIPALYLVTPCSRRQCHH
jgi:hypothetical protein